MKISACLLLLAFLVSCGSSPPLEEKTIPQVSIPAAPAVPDVSPVESVSRELRDDVAAARDGVRLAAGGIAAAGAAAARLEELTAAAYREADEVAKKALLQIQEAAQATSLKLSETAAMLDAATSKLAEANLKSGELTAEVSDLKRDLALQSARVEEFREIAAVANHRIDEANEQKDNFRNALTEASADVATAEKEVARVARHRRWLLITSIVLLLCVGGLSYIMLKI